MAVYNIETEYVAPSTKAEERVDKLVLCTVLYVFNKEEQQTSHRRIDGGANLGGVWGQVQEALDVFKDWSGLMAYVVPGGTASVHLDVHGKSKLCSSCLKFVLQFSWSELTLLCCVKISLVRNNLQCYFY